MLFTGFAALTVPLADVSAREWQLREKGVSHQPDLVEIRGVGAGPFDASHWENGTLNFVADIRHPLIAPREGAFRNIYAPSAVQTPGGWEIYYGGWDGSPSGNDRIYCQDTSDFLSFEKPHTVIEHGVFQHVCNVNAIRSEHGTSLTCTAFPDVNGWNKPAIFSLPFQHSSNAPFVAGQPDIIQVTGYDKYPDADINGMNVLLLEEGVYRLYFSNFRDYGKVYRASSRDGRSFQFEGSVLDERVGVNDMKLFHIASGRKYLMGSHANRGRIFSALSDNGTSFTHHRTLFSHRDDADKYMVAVGWVTSGAQSAADRKLLGVLYGAGAVPSLDRNRIFARWLQKKLVAADDSSSITVEGSLGPDRVLVRTSTTPGKLSLDLLAEDGQTTIGHLKADALKPGRAYSIE